MISNQAKSLGLLCLLWVSAVHSWGTACPNCAQDSDFLKVASWNANLVPGVSGNTQERLNGAISYFSGPEISALGLDLLCLQEVYGSGQQSMINGLKNSFPYSYTGDQSGQQGQCLKVCNVQAITVLTNCSSTCTDQNGSNCFTAASCNQQFLALDANCQACVGNGKGSAADILRACAMDANANVAIVNPNCNLAGGSSGNMIFSTQPFTATQTFKFNTQGNTPSNALWAQIQWRGNNVNFVCTNLLPDNMMTANASQDNSAQMNSQQTQELIQFLNTIPAGQPLIVAGDFNFGPAVGQNAGMFVDSYNAMVGAGFQSALITNVPADQVPCTSCTNGNYVTTHIFVKSNTTPPACINDVNLVGLNQTVTANGQQVPLSNSAGVYATICYAGQAAPSPPPAIQQQQVVVLPIQHINDDQTRFGEVSNSGSAALPVIMFSAAAALSFFF